MVGAAGGVEAARGPAYPPSRGQSAIYACDDQREVEVLYSGGDAVVLTVGGRTVQLARTPSPSGEYYVGDGWQWLGTGPRQGMIGGAGQDAAGGVVCRAR